MSNKNAARDGDPKCVGRVERNNNTTEANVLLSTKPSHHPIRQPSRNTTLDTVTLSLFEVPARPRNPKASCSFQWTPSYTPHEGIKLALPSEEFELREREVRRPDEMDVLRGCSLPRRSAAHTHPIGFQLTNPLFPGSATDVPERTNEVSVFLLSGAGQGTSVLSSRGGTERNGNPGSLARGIGGNSTCGHH